MQMCILNFQMYVKVSDISCFRDSNMIYQAKCNSGFLKFISIKANISFNGLLGNINRYVVRRSDLFLSCLTAEKFLLMFLVFLIQIWYINQSTFCLSRFEIAVLWFSFALNPASVLLSKSDCSFLARIRSRFIDRWLFLSSIVFNNKPKRFSETKFCKRLSDICCCSLVTISISFLMLLSC